MTPWYSKEDIKISKKDVIELDDLHGFVLPHAGTQYTKQVLNSVLRFKPTKRFNKVYIFYYPAYPTENVTYSGKKYYHEYFVIKMVLSFVFLNIWGIKTLITIVPVNVRDRNKYKKTKGNKRHDPKKTLKRRRFDVNSLYVISADFSHYKPMNKILEVENCSAHTINYNNFQSRPDCVAEIDHVDTFKWVYNLLPANIQFQWIARSRSPGLDAVGYLGFLLKDTLKIYKNPNKISGFFCTVYDEKMVARECLGTYFKNPKTWSKDYERQFVNDVLEKAHKTSRLTGGPPKPNTPIRHYTITYLYEEPRGTKFLRGYHAIKSSALYLPEVFLENVYENGKWVTSSDKQWDHKNIDNFNLDETLVKLGSKGGKYTNDFTLYSTKVAHFTLP